MFKEKLCQKSDEYTLLKHLKNEEIRANKIYFWLFSIQKVKKINYDSTGTRTQDLLRVKEA